MFDTLASRVVQATAWCLDIGRIFSVTGIGFGSREMAIKGLPDYFRSNLLKLQVCRSQHDKRKKGRWNREKNTSLLNTLSFPLPSDSPFLLTLTTHGQIWPIAYFSIQFLFYYYVFIIAS